MAEALVSRQVIEEVLDQRTEAALWAANARPTAEAGATANGGRAVATAGTLAARAAADSAPPLALPSGPELEVAPSAREARAPSVESDETVLVSPKTSSPASARGAMACPWHSCPAKEEHGRWRAPTGSNLAMGGGQTVGWGRMGRMGEVAPL